jgi:hypothetical protein
VVDDDKVLLYAPDTALDSTHAVECLAAAAVVNQVPVDPQQGTAIAQLANDVPRPELVE